MRLLIVTNLYPPYYVGGYELRCAQVAEALHRAGHEVIVLTSTYGLSPEERARFHSGFTEMTNGLRVCRWLNEYASGSIPEGRPWTLVHARRELHDARQFRELVTTFKPSVVNWWNMYGLSKLLLPLPASSGIPDVHWIEDLWMINEYGPAGENALSFWSAVWDGHWGPKSLRFLFHFLGRHWERRVRKEGLPTRAFPNQPSHVCFVSDYMQTLHHNGGFSFASTEVIHGSVPAEMFYHPVQTRSPSIPLRVLYAGQISLDRGLHTLLEAINLLASDVRRRLRLSVAGQGSEKYVSELERLVQASGLQDCVSFLGKVKHEQMPGVFKTHDVLVFPSTRHEGLPLTMVEAMLAGCVVVTTGSGGAMEIAALADLPLFPKEDPQALSHLLATLLSDRSQIYKIALRGQEVAMKEFNFDRMMERLTTTLNRVIATTGSKGKSVLEPLWLGRPHQEMLAGKANGQ